MGDVPLYPSSGDGVRFDLTLAAILCEGGLDVIRKEAWPFYKTISGVRLLGARRT